MRKLNKSLCFRCTEDQRTWVNEYVQAQGMTFQQWLATVLESLGMPSSDSEQNQSLNGFEQMSLYDVIEKERISSLFCVFKAMFQSNTIN